MMPRPDIREFLHTFAYIGLNSFGGPAGQIAVMHRVLVDQRKWLNEERFLHALNFCMLLPGPEAMQLATYAGWLLRGTWGGILAGLLFVLPGALLMWLLSAVYMHFQAMPVVASIFFGLKAAVLALVLEALLRVSRRALKTREASLVAIAAFLALFLFSVPFPLVVLAAAIFGWLRSSGHTREFSGQTESTDETPPTRGPGWRLDTLKVLILWGGLWLTPLMLLLLTLGGESTLFQIGWLFSKAAMVTFGGAYAVLAYIAQQGVERYAWLNPAEMADALALAETTPGPLILVTQFIGFAAAFRDAGSLPPLLAGSLGAGLTLWVTFVPCFLWIFLGAPHVEALRHHRPMANALAAITAAVVGVIANLGLWFAFHTLFSETAQFQYGPLVPTLPVLSTFQWGSLAIAVAAFIALTRHHLNIITVLFCSAIVGWILNSL